MTTTFTLFAKWNKSQLPSCPMNFHKRMEGTLNQGLLPKPFSSQISAPNPSSDTLHFAMKSSFGMINRDCSGNSLDLMDRLVHKFWRNFKVYPILRDNRCKFYSSIKSKLMLQETEEFEFRFF